MFLGTRFESFVRTPYQVRRNIAKVYTVFRLFHELTLLLRTCFKIFGALLARAPSHSQKVYRFFAKASLQRERYGPPGEICRETLSSKA